MKLVRTFDTLRQQTSKLLLLTPFRDQHTLCHAREELKNLVEQNDGEGKNEDPLPLFKVKRLKLEQ